jgi:hypothetical protein
MMQPFSLRCLIPFVLVVLLLPACSDSADEVADTTVAPTTTTVAPTTTTAAPTTTTTTTVAPTTTEAPPATGVDGALPVELSHSEVHIDTAFAAEGMAVDEGVMCPVGMTGDRTFESVGGAALTDEDWADMFDSTSRLGVLLKCM